MAVDVQRVILNAIDLLRSCIMNTLKNILLRATVLLGISLCGCSKPSASMTTELKYYPADNMDGLISRKDITLDKKVSVDGNDSLRITVSEPTTIRLYETGDLNVENVIIIYKAQLRTHNLDGKAHLEMLCQFPDRGEFFSRNLQSPISGTQKWSRKETPFILGDGENPNNIRLNLLIDGKGTVWIDDIHLISIPAPSGMSKT